MKTTAAQIFLNYCQLNGHMHTAEAVRRIVERERAEAGDAAKSSAAICGDLFAPAMSSMPPSKETPPKPAQSAQDGVELSLWEWPDFIGSGGKAPGEPLLSRASRREVEPEPSPASGRNAMQQAYYDQHKAAMANQQNIMAYSGQQNMAWMLGSHHRAHTKHRWIMLDGSPNLSPACR